MLAHLLTLALAAAEPSPRVQARSHVFVGSVVARPDASRRLEVRGPDSTLAFELAPEARLVAQGRVAKPADLVAGTRVVVTCDDGPGEVHRAIHVRLLPAKPR